MRFPVFARRSNPSIDRPIQRKSPSYCTAQVDTLAADWVDENDHGKGIVAREMLYFGPRSYRPPELTRDTVALPHLRWSGPKPPWRVGRLIRETPMQCAILA